MNILFLSWGVLPQKLGGLEKVTYYALKYLDLFDHNVTLIIPNKTEEIERYTESKLKRSKIIGVNLDISKFGIYPDYKSLINAYKKSIFSYFRNVIDYKKLVMEYAERVLYLVDNLNIKFDVIYSYDWLTFPAALELKKKYGKPIVWHVHSTAYDRVGGNPDNLKYLIDLDYGIELKACEESDKIIAVSNRVKDILVTYYNCNPNKIEIVYNAPDDNSVIGKRNWYFIKEHYKIVLYLGRMSMHKGPDWLLKAAKMVLEKRRDVLFLFAGTGEMLEQLIKMAADLGIFENTIFLGRVSDEEAEFLYDIADIFVLPSVSEPFGLTPFEALQHETPVIISKQSGVAEVLRSALKVDFWDVNKMANYILALLEYDILGKYEVLNCIKEMSELSWEKSIKRIEEIMKNLFV